MVGQIAQCGLQQHTQGFGRRTGVEAPSVAAGRDGSLRLRWRVADIEAFIARQASGASSGPRLLSVAQVAERLGMSAGAVYQMGDRLPGRVKIGSRVRYQEEAIAAIVERGLCQ